MVSIMVNGQYGQYGNKNGQYGNKNKFLLELKFRYFMGGLKLSFLVVFVGLLSERNSQNCVITKIQVTNLMSSR